MVESLLPPSGSTGLTIKDAIQDFESLPPLVSHVLPRWGMSQGTIYLGKSSNQGRSWTLLSQGSMGATAGSIPFVGNIGDTDVEMWESNDGTTLWAWYRYNSGLLYYSSGGAAIG